MAFKNRNLELPDSCELLYEISDKEDVMVEKIAHTNQMR